MGAGGEWFWWKMWLSEGRRWCCEAKGAELIDAPVRSCAAKGDWYWEEEEPRRSSCRPGGYGGRLAKGEAEDEDADAECLDSMPVTDQGTLEQWNFRRRGRRNRMTAKSWLVGRLVFGKGPKTEQSGGLCSEVNLTTNGWLLGLKIRRTAICLRSLDRSQVSAQKKMH